MMMSGCKGLKKLSDRVNLSHVSKTLLIIKIKHFICIYS